MSAYCMEIGEGWLVFRAEVVVARLVGSPILNFGCYVVELGLARALRILEHLHLLVRQALTSLLLFFPPPPWGTHHVQNGHPDGRGSECHVETIEKEAEE